MKWMIQKWLYALKKLQYFKAIYSEDDHHGQIFGDDLEDVQTSSSSIMKMRKFNIYMKRNYQRISIMAECQRMSKLKQQKIVTDMKVRWNTTYDMLKWNVENKMVITRI